MRPLGLISAALLTIGVSAAYAQSSPGAGIRVESGHFCALNKCVRFSRDLSSVSIQGRIPVSVAGYDLRRNPLISPEVYREIFYLALRQRGVNGTR
jgi:hypothetical protein